MEAWTGHTDEEMAMGRTFVSIVLSLTLGLGSSGLSGQPSTDIYLGKLQYHDGRIEIDSLYNITDRDGYDNQPHFTPDGRSLLYTSIREDGQADTYRYDLVTGAIERVTRTEESEYSPITVPEGDAFSVVQVEADSSQRLWHFDLQGSNRGILLPDLEPVGYYTWCDAGKVAAFVLGEPPTLRLVDLGTGESEILAQDIGRSLHMVPGGRWLSFVEKVAEDEWWITKLDLSTGEQERLLTTPPGREDFAWTPTGDLLMARGSTLLRWSAGGGQGWEEVADLAAGDLQNITRIAVSNDGRRIALVAVHADGG